MVFKNNNSIKLNNNSIKLAFKPQRSLGQNFLSSQEYLNKIVESCLINKNSRIIEIGPGYGTLTKLLIKESSESIVSIEKDENLFNWLNTNLSDSSKVDFILGDALDIDWEELIKDKFHSEENEIIVVGNLPYNISNKLISNLLEKRHLFKKLVFLVQKEVGQRWVANPLKYKNKYSNLSVFINYFCDTSLNFEIPKKFFKPVPEVDGALICLNLKPNNSIDLEEKKFFSFVKNCFRFRRKTLFNNLKSFWGDENKINAAFEKLAYDEKIRSQDLFLRDFLLLFNEFSLKTQNIN
ncbi:MAG: Ribosomal RNA small subunit methyltransferase A [Mycoplasmataceae bacterium]|nr:MAG: Ribosomal RNA small subunit methyltransferase A [Mycoplasmataceae bacterium]